MNLSDDDFTLFGLPARFALNRDDLDQRWRALQGEVHPDKFVSQGPAAQRLAMQWAMRVNEAYRRLREPLLRAAYLCGLRGSPIEAEDNTAMPAEFLIEQMQWRETLEEARTTDEIQALADEVAVQQSKRHQDIAHWLDEANQPEHAARDVRALMFMQRLQQDIERRLDALPSPR